MPTAVVDSTCLIALERIGQLDLVDRLLAKRKGIIPACRPLLDALVSEGFHMSDDLYEEALRLAAEAR